ncbi:hypothetical protein N7456_001022 [Penicillium angulare]|uniref:Uncharacterized protein n=1 Tax=Penicillium angulare TaxID=116970 RepID=A0A9W9KSS9_9EURO|nr:hypothetical protein N7456_001022 [Penicillium angulare]
MYEPKTKGTAQTNVTKNHVIQAKAPSDSEANHTTSKHATHDSNDKKPCMTCIGQAIDKEFCSRRVHTYHNPQIHHFNMDGQCVFGPNSTTPAECLAIILSQKQRTDPSLNGYLVKSIINRARVFVDPVATTLDPNSLYLRGSELIDAAQGKVQKCFSDHGWWQLVAREAEGISVLPSDPQVYLSTEILYASGFLNSPDINVAREWVVDKASPYVRSPRGCSRKLNFKRKQSPLCVFKVQNADQVT